jgi:hypothetical protein
MTAEQEPLTRARIRLQACRNADTCPCEHIDCCDGWMIQPPLTREPAQRCPHCYDAVLMRAELVEQRERDLSKQRGWRR